MSKARQERHALFAPLSLEFHTCSCHGGVHAKLVIELIQQTLLLEKYGWGTEYITFFKGGPADPSLHPTASKIHATLEEALCTYCDQ
jgi:hypothetical protein